MHTRLFAVLATVGLVLFALGPGAATVAADSAGNDALGVSVSQAGNTGPVVTVTDNGTAIQNASVTVDALDNGTYAGVGEPYATDANGTVTLPEPDENVSVTVTATAGNATGSTTADLIASGESDAAPDSFGDRVSAFVQALLSGDSIAIGQRVAEFATENNPGNAPEWAGPPEDGERGPPEDGERGPPEQVGQVDNETEDDRRGPPEQAGQADNETEDDRRGPPADAGPSDDSDDETVESETTEAEETEDDSADSDGGSDDSGDSGDGADSDDSGGPPDHARGNGN